MKKILIFLTAAALLVSLCACAEKAGSSASEPVSPAPAKLPAEPVPLTPRELPADSELTLPPDAPVEEAVSIEPSSPVETPEFCIAAPDESGVCRDGSGAEIGYHYRVPYLTMNSIGADQINRRISELCTPILEEQHALLDAGESVVCTEIDYSAVMTEQLVSILLRVDTESDSDAYYPFNLSLATGRMLEGSLLETLGWEESRFTEAAMAAAEAKFIELCGRVGDDFYAEQYNKTMSADAFGKTMPMYLNGEGKLCVIAEIYSLAGSDYILCPLCIE